MPALPACPQRPRTALAQGGGQFRDSDVKLAALRWAGEAVWPGVLEGGLLAAMLSS